MARQEAQFPCLSLRQNLRWLSDKKYIFKSRRPLSDLYAGSGWNACQLPVGATSGHFGQRCELACRSAFLYRSGPRPLPGRRRHKHRQPRPFIEVSCRWRRCSRRSVPRLHGSDEFLLGKVERGPNPFSSEIAKAIPAPLRADFPLPETGHNLGVARGKHPKRSGPWPIRHERPQRHWWPNDSQSQQDSWLPSRASCQPTFVLPHFFVCDSLSSLRDGLPNSVRL